MARIVLDMDITTTATADASTLAPPSWVDEIREGLLAHAFLFDDPRGYSAGVHDTLAEVESMLDRTRQQRAG